MILVLRLMLIMALICALAAFWVWNDTWSPHLLHAALLLTFTAAALWIGQKTQPKAEDASR